MADSVPIIEINNLSHRFPDGNLALKGINLSIEKDSFTVICGENGSGKTVLMKHLNGILEPSEGEVRIAGISVQKDSNNACRKIGFVFQNSNTQFVAQSVRDDIAFGPENLGLKLKEIEERVKVSAKALNLCSILEHSPHRLSGGEKKKTAIAGVIAMDAELIVFDEPFAGLDYRGVQMLLNKMLQLRAEGISIIVISHDLEKVLALADRLVIVSDGKIVGNGLPGEMLTLAEKHGMRIPQDKSIESMSWLKESV